MEIFDTKILTPNEADIANIAKLLQDGEVVGVPTETVYGLAGNAFDESAIEKIFLAKGRPQDNPLIVHISNFSFLERLAKNIPPLFFTLAEKFWPGPLTMIVEKSDALPLKTSGGLNTVGIRMPSHQAFLDIITKSDLPLAAPSGNISGRPSPTNALDMLFDMQGKIPAIMDGGSCSIGVESTVISFDDDCIHLLRPGYISAEQLSEFAEVIIDKGVTEKIASNEKAISPGMKYKHYSPKANVFLVDSDFSEFVDFSKNIKDENFCVVIADQEKNCIQKANIPYITFGSSLEEQAKNLFFTLRELDKKGIENAYFRLPKKDGVGLALYNRLVRAAGYKIVQNH